MTQDPNLEFRLRLGHGEGFRIILSERSGPAPNLVTPSRRVGHGAIKRRRPSDGVLGRRKKGFINFYDLGQIKSMSGDWVDIDFNIPLILTDTITGVTITGVMTLSDWNAYSSIFFSTSDWKTTYRKLLIDEAERYGLEVWDIDGPFYYPVARDGSVLVAGDGSPGTVLSDTKWQAQGLNVGPIPNFQIQSSGAFSPFDNSSNFKITTVPLYSGSSTSLTSLEAGDNVFLVPCILGISGFCVDSLTGLSQRFIGTQTFLPRAIWKDANYLASPHYPLYSYYPDNGSLPSGTETGVISLTAILSDQIAKGAGALETDPAHTGLSITSDPSTYPKYSDDQNIFIIDAIFDNGEGSSVIANLQYKEGTFVGAVERGSTMHYFWAASDGLSLFTGGRRWRI